MKKILPFLFIALSLLGETPSQLIESQKSAFEQYKQTQLSGLQKYKEAQAQAYEDYKKGIATVWEEPKMSTKKKWLSYSDDKKTRSDVDFEKETITVEAIAKTPEEAKQKLQIALAKVVTIDTKKAQESDPLEKKLAKIQTPKEIVVADVKAEPILSTVIFKKKPTKKSVVKYVNKHINKQTIKVLPSKKIKDAFIYKVKVNMPKGALYKRSHLYYSEIKKQSNNQGIPLELTFAIMHTESYFNPRARSLVPAFGLMQIVPKSAGVDAYFYLYNRKKLVSGSYLYNTTNNIKMGTAYLHLLYYRYLKKIKNPQSRLYCAIAAYNTGAGNIAYAFTKHYNMNKAAPLINRLAPDAVYAKLQKDLRYNEPKVYLKNVKQRMKTYHKMYVVR